MDVRRTFPFLLLMICAAFAIRNNHGGLNNIRRIRKASLSEYLVPPPPPRFYPGRSPRTAPSTEEPGYFMKFMNWINPFNYGTTLPSLPPPPPPSTSYETIYTSSPKFNQPRPPPPADYDKPPLPPSSFNNNAGYSTPAKTTNCNSCNKVPWTPLQTNDVTQSEDDSHASPTPQVLPTNGNYPSLINGNYPPPSNPEIPYDAHHAASQDVTAPDYTIISLSEQDLGSSSDPRLYPGLVPPVNKAHNFHSPTTSVKYSSYLNTVDPSLGKYPFYPHSPTSSSLTSPVVINQELGYNSHASDHGQFSIQNYDAHSDLSSSGTQVNHANPVPDNQKFENVESHSSLSDSSHQQASFGSLNVLQSSGISNNERPYYVTRLLDDSIGNSSQTDQNFPSSYETSGPDQVPNNSENRYSDLSSSGNVAKNTYASLSTPVESSTKIEDSIHFEESPLLDFSHKGESRTKSSSIPPTSNAIADSAEAVESTLAPGEEVFGTRQRVASYSQTTDPLSLQPKVNITKNSDRSVYNSKVMRIPNISYVPSSAKTTVSQKSSISTMMTTTTTTTTPPPESIWSRFAFPWPFSLYTDVKSTNDSEKDAFNQNADLNSEDTNETSVKERGLKKQVQLIIPYTQQHTPLPFYTQKVPQIGSNHDTYIAEESAKEIKVTSLPDSTNAVTSPTTSVTLEDRTRKPAGTVANNSIDVHKLQKNIDNWTIQEYAKSTIASTASPSSANPYLLPSKKIPHEYFTSTESLEHLIGFYNNVKTINLAGFTFKDIDYKTSTSNRVEKSQVQKSEVQKSEVQKSQVQKSQVQEAQKNSTNDTSISSLNNDDAWRGFSLDISHVNKERVYVVTSKSIVTTLKPNPIEQRKETAIKEKNPKESRQETDTRKSTTNTFEKAYQVLPQAVNNLAVASTGPESVTLWGIMEHEEFATLDDKEHDETDEADETSETPVLYFGHSKVSRARR